MPISFTLEPLPPTRALAVVRLSGTVGPADLRAFNRDLYRGGAFDPAWPMLIDIRALDRPSTRAEIEEIAVDLGRLPDEPGARRAVVADGGAYYGISRTLVALAAMHGARAETRVFQDLDEARRWSRE